MIGYNPFKVGSPWRGPTRKKKKKYPYGEWLKVVMYREKKNFLFPYRVAV